MPIVLNKKKGESKDELLGRFRRFTMEEEITEEIRRRAHYQSPSQKRYEQKKTVARRLYGQKKRASRNKNK